MTVETPSRAPSPPALRSHDAAAYLGVSLATLRKWRALGRGPRAHLAGGGLLYYPVDELDRWMTGHSQEDGTPDPAA